MFGWDDIALAGTTALFGLGSNLISNKLISQPNSGMSFQQQKVLQARQDNMNSQAATTAWNRSLLAGQIQNDRNKKAALTAYNREIEAYKNRYQMTMDDMKNAGLNPILMASKGFNTGSGVQGYGYTSTTPQVPMSSVGLGTGTKPDYPRGSSSALDVAKTFTQKAVAKKTGAEVGLVMQKILESIQEVRTKRTQQGLMEQQEREAAARTYNLGLESSEISARINKTLEEVTVLQTKGSLNRQEMKKLEVDRARIKKEIDLLAEKIKQTGLYVTRLKKLAPVWNDLGDTYMQGIHEIFKAILGKSVSFGIIDDAYVIKNLGQKLGQWLRKNRRK